MRTSGVVAVVVGLVSVSVLTVEPAHAAVGKIVYGSSGHIFIMNDDGSGSPVDLTPGWTDFASDPSLSPDGTTVLFETNFFQSSGELYVIPTTPTSQADAHRLTNNSVGDMDPVWSPSGAKIAFTRDVPSSGVPRNFEIFTMNADGSGATRITSDATGGYDDMPTWSPDGTKIAYSSANDNFYCTEDGGSYFIGLDQIHVINATGGGDVDLTNDPTLAAGNPDWSPDGTRIAFDADQYTVNQDGSCGGSSGNTVYLIGSDGSGTAAVRAGYAPAWSPAGDRLVFNTSLGGPLATMSADGTDVVPLGVNGTRADWGGTASSPAATTTTVNVKRGTKIRVSGDVTPTVAGQSVTVTLYRKSAGKFHKVIGQTAVLGSDSTYAATFSHPKAGTCKVTTRYPGDATHLASKKSLTFAC